MKMKKEDLQEWLGGLKCSHFITIEPTPHLPFSRYEIEQRLRIVEFKLNKRYLGNSFTKWKNDEDKFYFIVFPEGDGVYKQKHYHALLHTPQTVMKKKFWYEQGVARDLKDYWCIVPSKNPTTHKLRNLEELRNILDIEKVTSCSASSRYASKTYNAWIERLGFGDEEKRYFFTTPPKSQKTKNESSVK